MDQKGSISPEQNAQLKKVYKLHKRAIDIVLKREAENISNTWVPELIKAAEKEGIKFPRFTKS